MPRSSSSKLSPKELALCRQAAEACACLNFRKASRVVTQFYDEALAPSGLRSTQVVILMAAALFEEPAIGDLAEALVMDRTTLTRNLRPLEKQGLLGVVSGEDRRRRVVRLSSKGHGALRRALPLWKQSQRRFVQILGQSRWRQMRAGLKKTVTSTSAMVRAGQ